MAFGGVGVMQRYTYRVRGIRRVSNKPVITRDRLVELLSYDEDSGNLVWNVRRRGQVNPGDIAGHLDATGYVHARLDGRLYKAHRLVWLHVTGAWPLNCLDHIDGNRANNRFGNLRDVVERVNRENRRTADADSATGVLGTSPHGRGYMAQIVAHGRHHYLGTHDTVEQAHEAYVEAKRKLHVGCTL